MVELIAFRRCEMQMAPDRVYTRICAFITFVAHYAKSLILCFLLCYFSTFTAMYN